MGELVAMRYPTKLFAGLADHTYVRCANGGRAWACWGGKSGGGSLRSGPGSTRRANAIAQTNERAGITCYLVNGVCHQAANRILYPASITVRGARGYDVSELLFGTYGRPGGIFGLCKAPFHRHDGVTGDLRPCLTEPAFAATPEIEGAAPTANRQAELAYLARVIEAYGPETRSPQGSDSDDLEFRIDFSHHLLDLKIDFNLGDAVNLDKRKLLHELRKSVEVARAPIESGFAREAMPAQEFAMLLEKVFTGFQNDAVGILGPALFKALFGQDPGDVIRLADPSLIAKAYPGR